MCILCNTLTAQHPHVSPISGLHIWSYFKHLLLRFGSIFLFMNRHKPSGYYYSYSYFYFYSYFYSYSYS